MIMFNTNFDLKWKDLAHILYFVLRVTAQIGLLRRSGIKVQIWIHKQWVLLEPCQRSYDDQSNIKGGNPWAKYQKINPKCSTGLKVAIKCLLYNWIMWLITYLFQDGVWWPCSVFHTYPSWYPGECTLKVL